MALFHHPRLAEFWKSKLSRRSWLTLRHIIPDSWIVDPVIDDLPPSATLWAPLINGKGVRNWTEIADASQKNRRLILKCSGFNELAWGARSVVVGHDVSKETWHRALSHALDNSDKEVHIIQTYKNPKIYEHPVYDEPHVTTNKAWRIRLCPFYFLNEKGAPDLAGALATLCPKDKKVIHGMRDACMLPATLNHAPVL